MKLIEMPSRKPYSLEYKLKVVSRWHELNDNTLATSREFGSARRMIDRWVAQENSLRHETARKRKCGATLRKKRRLPPADHCCNFHDMEAELVEWVKSKRDEGLAVHGKAICKKAKDILSDHYGNDIPEFKASSGWMSRILKRSGLVSRRVTSTGQELPKDAARCGNFFLPLLALPSKTLT